MRPPVESMPIASLHAFVVREETGVVGMVGSDAPTAWYLRIELVRGWIHAMSVEATPTDAQPRPEPRNEKERRALAEALEAREQAVLAHRGYVGASLQQLSAPQRFHQLLLSSVRSGHRAQLLPESRGQRGAVAPFHPQRAMRAVIHELVGSAQPDVDALVAAPTRTRMQLLGALHRSGLDPDEEWAASLLARGLGWDQLVARSRCTPPRLARFVREAMLLGVLEVDGAPSLRAEVTALLLDPARLAAIAAEKRRAYHRQARDVHPDLHPDADDAEKAARTAAMAELALRRKKET